MTTNREQKTLFRMLIGIWKFAFVAVSIFPIVASAATTITVDSVAQRWPWNNKVDITYTIIGGQNLSASEFRKIVFTATIDGAVYTIDGSTDVGASANAGTHTVTWTAPSGIKCMNCTMTAAVYAADAPSGDDYMIIDLDTGAISYEGLLASQEDSNARYNTDLYKATNNANKCCMVLRKVPAGGHYPTGDSTNYASKDSATTWTTDRDYYIGVFPVTQYQYQKLYGSNPSVYKTNKPDNPVAQRPVEQVSWDDLRLATTAPTSSIPATASNSGTFFQRLNYITGNKFGFDLPTEVMFEIAERAGATTVYYWGDTMVTNYVVCRENSGSSTVAVGSRLPNAWGLYDTAGNVWEWCLDESGPLANLADAQGVFTPACATGTERRFRGGGQSGTVSTSSNFHASYRNKSSSSFINNGVGFRVARIVK